jgi:hypothetical protein
METIDTEYILSYTPIARRRHREETERYAYLLAKHKIADVKPASKPSSAANAAMRF